MHISDPLKHEVLKRSNVFEVMNLFVSKMTIHIYSGKYESGFKNRFISLPVTLIFNAFLTL